MIVETGLTPPSGWHKRWLYNALDAALTLEVADALHPLVEADPLKARHYGFEMAQQAPAFAMSMRGIRVDPDARDEAEQAQNAIEAEAEKRLAELVAPIWDQTEQRTGKCADDKPHRWNNSVLEVRKNPEAAACPDDLAFCVKCHASRQVSKAINPRSPDQIKHLFYDLLMLPPERNHKDHKISVDDECLDRLSRKHAEARPYVDAVLAARGARKQAALLRTPLDPDGRWRTSFNVGAAVPGRWSSSDSPWGTGGNIQNVADRSRGIFVPDPGLVMFYADYEKAESNIVAHDAEDENYIKAHEAGDVHTFVSRLVWPDARPWTGDLKEDRKLADQPAPWDANHELRWYGKHVAHGTAIGMTEHGIARDARIKVKAAKEALGKFKRAFPRVFARQDEIWRDVCETRTVTSPLGRRRTFRGRIFGSDALATRREALAQIQQSTIADWVGIAITRVWLELDGGAALPRPSDPNRVWLLAQVHDAILGLVRPGDDEALARLQELMAFHLDIRGRRLVIPTEIKIGKSWRHDDLTTWKPGMAW
jgi:DNA polymerase I-like protein with 3'-5' exonuclease and polymerase domains